MTIVPHALAAGAGNALGQYSSAYGAVPGWMKNLGGAGDVSSAIGKVTTFVTGLAAGVGVCVFIYACIRLVASQGQEDKAAAAKKMAIIALIGVFLALSAKAIISALWSDTPMGSQTPSILRTILGFPS